MHDAFAKMDPEAMIKAWMPQGAPDWEQWQKMWRQGGSGS